jgi:hypothetical protein
MSCPKNIKTNKFCLVQEKYKKDCSETFDISYKLFREEELHIFLVSTFAIF